MSALAVAVADLVNSPAECASAVRAGFAELGDPVYAAFQRRIAPGLDAPLGVRSGLQDAFRRELWRELEGVRPSALVEVADALLAAAVPELTWLAISVLARILPAEPERSWQLMRRVAREAGEWITIDTLAHAYGVGILAEDYRWAELEQLAYAPSRWERRLVGSTIATIPYVDRTAGRTDAVVARALPLLADLIGDREPDVQKALSWALRNLTAVDPVAVREFCRRETAAAVAAADGHRAWVVRDTLPKLDPAVAADLRARLAPIRRRPGEPSTSRAAATAARFTTPAEPRLTPEPPLS